MPPRPRALLPDLAPWRASRDFRRLWWSGLITSFGSRLTYVALPVQIKELTGSALAVGAIGAVELVPLIVFGLYGGALADALDRRGLILRTEAALGLLSAVLLANTLLPHPRVWPLYVVAALASAADGLQGPAMESIVPRIVRHEHLTAAAALNSLQHQLGAIAGPSLAGVLIAYAGPGWAYGLDVLSFAVSLALCRTLAPVPPAHDARAPSLRGIAEGARYAWGRKELLGSYAVDLVAMFFAFPIAVFPFLADELRVPWALGLMYAALPAGALLVSATSGWMTRVHRHGRAVAVAAGLWGLAMAGAGRAGNIWLVLVLLAAAGGCDEISAIFRDALWNQTIPDELRGRLAGIAVLVVSAGPQLGQVRAGGVAALTSARTAVWSGGAACVAGIGLLALGLPRLLAYDARTDEHAVRMRAAAAGPAPAGSPAAG